MAIIDQEAISKRAATLGSLNGIHLVLVALQPAVSSQEAVLDLYFYNENELSNMIRDLSTSPDLATTIFPIRGGHRVLGGNAAGQVQVTQVTGDVSKKKLRLIVSPIGDYSTYTLNIVYRNIDPVFNEIDFKFRPGCFNVNCAPEWQIPEKPKLEPNINYLAKDFDSFRHTMMAMMTQRVPHWTPTSRAALDDVLIDLFSAAADELSDYQDRVANEAYLGSARKRISLARHVRMVDYHIHQGNQSSALLACEVQNVDAHIIAKDFVIQTGYEKDGSAGVSFSVREDRFTHRLLNRMSLYTWSDTVPALAEGSTSADLKLVDSNQAAVEEVRGLLKEKKFTRLVLQEHLNPRTGQSAGRDPIKRQLLELLTDDEDSEVIQDPQTSAWILRVHWKPEDALHANYCFVVDGPTGKVEDISLFHGNLVEVYQGAPRRFRFLEPSEKLIESTDYHFERTERGVICTLPETPLAFIPTEPGGQEPSRSSIRLQVEIPGGGKDDWDEVISLIHSDGSDENGDHFVVEVDELKRGFLRFGDGVNGKALPDGAIIHCSYQVGGGVIGNVGADSLSSFDSKATPEIKHCWNPFDVTNGRDPESVDSILRNAPEAYRAKQLRAVTLVDYVKRVEELEKVSRASASYAWVGSWRTVRIIVDPMGTTEINSELDEEIRSHLEVFRLLGEDYEIRTPNFVPLEIFVSVCIHADYWRQDIRYILENEFSEFHTPDGRRGFFHPDEWTFGQALYESQIAGRIYEITGIDRIRFINMRRWNAHTPGTGKKIEISPQEIIQVRNDPNHMESGFIRFDMKGGRK
ncbi:MAG: hypothetical protein AAGA18_13820 [Verrucomicrobiota bacterium]